MCEIELHADFAWLFHNHLLGDDHDPFQERDEDPEEGIEDQSDSLSRRTHRQREEMMSQFFKCINSGGNEPSVAHTSK
jgi:hypothetical protein